MWVLFPRHIQRLQARVMTIWYLIIWTVRLTRMSGENYSHRLTLQTAWMKSDGEKTLKQIKEIDPGAFIILRQAVKL